MKKFILTIFAVILLAATFSQATLANSDISPINILFEHTTTYQPSRGVTYYQSRMMTAHGMLDVHVLRVDLHDPYIYVAPVTSGAELGLRETTTNLLYNAGAIGGINADFFGMAGAYSVHFGPMAQDGQLLAASTYANYHSNQFATFFLDNHNFPFFRYVRTSIRFANNGRENISINAYNNIGSNLDWPVAVSRTAMYDTESLNRRFEGLTKIVVENHAVRHISQPGETVTVPENGFVVILPERMAYRRRYFNVGEQAMMWITNNMHINYLGIQAAIGGGGLILQNGQFMYNRGVAPATRHPRSAVGTSRCGRYLILMTVDGRSHSVGATHAEMAYLLTRFGAHNAMHFDGGGSTTLVTSDRAGNLSVANTPADGGQRRVVNALGVFDGAEAGELYRLVLEANIPRAIVGMPLYANVFGEDELWTRVAVSTAGVTLYVEDETGGTWYGRRFTPTRAGAHVLKAAYGELSATLTIYAYNIAEIVPITNAISIFEGGQATLQFSGVATCGTSLPVPSVAALSVTPAHLGRFENGVFVATSGGAGFITARIGNISAYIPVSVGGFPIPVNMFAGQVGQLSVPASNITNVSVRNFEQNRRAISMNYTFEISTATQAAYVTFYPPLALPAIGNRQPVGLRLYVNGDGSGHWLRGRVQDGEGNTHLIDFARSADFIGWESVIAPLPNAPGPFTIDQIYMVTLNSYERTSHSVMFYRLEAMFAPVNEVQLPQRTTFTDPLRAVGTPAGTVHEFAVPTEAEYSVGRSGNFAVARLSVRDGRIVRNQWGQFLQDIRTLDMPYVVVLMDANPLNFRQRMEFELFHLAMQELRAEGRMVFVVSATGQETTLTMRDGVRYINLAEVDEYEEAIIRFWINGSEIRWG